MKTKVCGLREPDNIREVMALGVDYLGFIFYERSQRYARSQVLTEFLESHADQFPRTAKVGVFVNAEVDDILNTVHDYQLDYVQLHGNESAGYCRELKLLWSVSTLRKAQIIKAFSITPDFNFADTNAYVDSCPLFVFDTGGQAEKGGTGIRWDWTKLKEYNGPVPFLLSGGIGPADATDVRGVRHPQLAGVDLNSKFETEPGVKDTRLLEIFLRDLREN